MRVFTQLLGLALILLLPLGCGHRSTLTRKVLYSKVKCGGQSVQRGFIRFVPLDGTAGPTTMARIVDGKYRADNRGGVPLGRHRVEIQAQRLTGKKIQLPEGKTDELAEIGDRLYAGLQSPLTVKVTRNSDGRM